MSKTMSGFDSPYIPGWDCHGIPIEIKDDGELGSKKATMSAAEVRRSAAQGLHPPRRFRPGRGGCVFNSEASLKVFAAGKKSVGPAMTN